MKTVILFASLLSINTSVAATSLDSYRPSSLKDCQESSTSGSLMCRFDVTESMVSGLITSAMKERAKDNWKSNEVDGRMTTFTFNISATEKTTYYVSLDKNGVYKNEPGITNVGLYVKDSAEVKVTNEQEKATTSNEGKIVNAIASTYKVVKDKSTQQMKRLYSSASQKTTVDQTSGSKAVTQVLTDAWIVNEGKKQIISSLKRDNEILLDNMAVKLQNINNDSLKQTLLKAQDLQIELQKDTDASASTANQMEKEVVANLGISNSLNTLAGAENNLILDEDEAHQAVDGEKILTAALASGKVDDYLKYQENLSDSIQGKGVVAAGALVASDISLLPLSFQTPEQIKKINQAKGLLDLDKKANSANTKSTTGTSSVAQSASGASSPAGLSSSASLSVVPFTEGKVVSGDFSVQRPPYLLESLYKSLFADPKQSQSFEIVAYLKGLEDLISYKVSRVTETALSDRPDRLDKTYYGFGYSQASLDNRASRIVNLYNEKAAIQKTIDVTIPERIKALEAEYDPQNPKWSNHMVKNKREPRYQLALSETQEEKKRLIKKLSTTNLIIYKESVVLLKSLFMLAESVCPKNMTLNKSWQMTKPDSKEGLRRYVCEGEDRKGHMISFDKEPSMPKHTKAEQGFVTLNPGSIKDSTGKYLYNSTSVIDLGTFECPDVTSTEIFGNEMNVQFSSVEYELSGSKQESARFFGGKTPTWKDSVYTSSSIPNNKRVGRCIPREHNKQYMNFDGKSTSANICEGEEIVVVDIIQYDRIDTKWKIDKTKSVDCTYEFKYTP